MRNLAEVERVFLLAIDLPKKERIEFIKNACRGDLEVESQVLSILKVESQSHCILDNVREAAAAIVSDHIASDESGDDVGLCELPVDVQRSVLKMIDPSRHPSSANPMSLADYESHFANYASKLGSRLGRVGFYLLIADFIRQKFGELAERSMSKSASSPNLVASQRHPDRVRSGNYDLRNYDLLEHAVDCFESEWKEHAQLFKLRHFLGLTLADAANVLGISEAEAVEKWTFAKAWINSALKASKPQTEM